MHIEYRVKALNLYVLHMWVVGLIYCSVCVGVKPYACSMCDMRFIQRNHLERHSLTHTGMRSFTAPRSLRGSTDHGTLGHIKLELELSSLSI